MDVKFNRKYIPKDRNLFPGVGTITPVRMNDFVEGLVEVLNTRGSVIIATQYFSDQIKEYFKLVPVTLENN